MVLCGQSALMLRRFGWRGVTKMMTTHTRRHTRGMIHWQHKMMMTHTRHHTFAYCHIYKNLHTVMLIFICVFLISISICILAHGTRIFMSMLLCIHLLAYCDMNMYLHAVICLCMLWYVHLFAHRYTHRIVLWGQSLLALRRFGWRAVNKIIAFVAHVIPEDKTKKIDTSGLLRGRNSQKSICR